jgi:hypothetical protein
MLTISDQESEKIYIWCHIHVHVHVHVFDFNGNMGMLQVSQVAYTASDLLSLKVRVAYAKRLGTRVQDLARWHTGGPSLQTKHSNRRTSLTQGKYHCLYSASLEIWLPYTIPKEQLASEKA